MSTQTETSDSITVESDVLTVDVWLNDDGHVRGNMYVLDSENGYDVTGVVDSYDYDDYGTERTNHVPRAILTKPNGSIIKEVSDHDSKHPQKAVDRAVSSAEWLYENAEQFIDE